jgi:hypothetical protein
VAASAWREPSRPAEIKAPPKEARCFACGGWIASAPGSTTWVKARCGNKRCPKYGEGQTIHLRDL